MADLTDWTPERLRALDVAVAEARLNKLPSVVLVVVLCFQCVLLWLTAHEQPRPWPGRATTIVEMYKPEPTTMEFKEADESYSIGPAPLAKPAFHCPIHGDLPAIYVATFRFHEKGKVEEHSYCIRCIMELLDKMVPEVVPVVRPEEGRR